MKALKITISGSYRNSKREHFDFEELTGVIPFVDQDLAKMHVRDRYAHLWIRNAKNPDGSKKYEDRVEETRTVHFDAIEETEVDTFSFIGKDIKEMGHEDFQDLATANDLRTIPLPKEISGVDLRELRTEAYAAYALRYFKEDIGHKKVDFDFSKLKPLVVGSTSSRDQMVRLTNEETLELQGRPADIKTLKSTLSMDDLKGIAKNKNIEHPPGASYDELHALIYGGGGSVAA